MVKTDLDKLVEDTNYLLLLRKIISLRLSLALTADSREDEAYTVEESRLRWKVEELCLELKTASKQTYNEYIDAIRVEYKYTELVLIEASIQHKIDNSMTILVKTILREPCEMMQVHQLMLQYGLYNLDNLIDTVSCFAVVSDVEPTDSMFFLLVGPNNQKYYLVAKPGFGYETEKPFKWFISSKS